ncbi:hypothetical protein J2T07_000037 [Luteibacter jiangsuensis]|uniref:Uncharacterized protein n=1 Tax=Luteibacter jiangsuensis TaxID=637577 RepID=A0ABT9SSB0_9GAMM|nr:hypothetical protein [Luteibacter jiangsuensis]MDQ0007878.1 hypothetical protein [Luteibacter jiangsuensis]
MNPNTPPPSDDDLPDERDLAALYARLPKAEPDPALDAVVLAQADRAVPARSRRAHWPIALGSAAVLVLAVGLAWQLRDSRPDVTATLPAATARRVESTGSASAPMQASAPAVLQESTRAAAPPRMARRSAPARSLAPAAPAPSVEAPAPAAEAESAPAQAPGQAFAPAPKSSTVSRTAPQAFGVASDRAMKTELGPDDRVGEIRQLLGRGEREEALRRLRELRERYPHYDLPQDLRDLTP